MKRALGLLFMIVAASLAPGADEPHIKVSSAGLLPLSNTVFASWLNGPSSDEYPRPFAMVYYRGRPGWLKEKIEGGFSFLQPSGLVVYSSTALGVNFEYNSKSGQFTIQDHVVELFVNNVFLISPIGDTTEKPSVHLLGHVMFVMTIQHPIC